MRVSDKSSMYFYLNILGSGTIVEDKVDSWFKMRTGRYYL